jgi:hypothetical protein
MLLLVYTIHCLSFLFFPQIISSAEQLAPGNLNFSLWDAVLKQYVFSGNQCFFLTSIPIEVTFFDLCLGQKDGISLNLINYSAIAKDKNFFEFGVELFNANTTGFNQSEFYAFWINVYNYLAIKLVVENPCERDMFGSCSPTTSIRNIGEQQPSM